MGTPLTLNAISLYLSIGSRIFSKIPVGALTKISVNGEQRNHVHYMKSVRIWSFSSPHLPTFGLNTER